MSNRVILCKENAKVFIISAAISCSLALYFRYLKFKKANELQELNHKEVLTQETLDKMSVSDLAAYLKENGYKILFSGKVKLNKTDFIATKDVKAVFIKEKHIDLEIKWSKKKIINEESLKRTVYNSSKSFKITNDKLARPSKRKVKCIVYNFGNGCSVMDSVLKLNNQEEHREDFAIDTEKLKDGEKVKIGTKKLEYVLVPDTQVCVLGKTEHRGEELQVVKPSYIGTSKQDIIDAFVMDRFLYFVGQVVFGLGTIGCSVLSFKCMI